MQIEQLTQGIESKFEQSRLVFWYDPEQGFKDEVLNSVVDWQKVANSIQISRNEQQVMRDAFYV
jgi:hypothetical protein